MFAYCFDKLEDIVATAGVQVVMYCRPISSASLRFVWVVSWHCTWRELEFRWILFSVH